MRHPLAFVLLPVLLVACVPSEPVPVETSYEIVISMEHDVEPMGNGVIRTREFMVVSGAADLRVPVREIESDVSNTLQLVHPDIAPDAVAFFTVYAPGAGDDVRVRRTSGGLVIERRMNSEMGPECGAWETLQAIQIDAETTVRIDYEGEIVDQLMFECE